MRKTKTSSSSTVFLAGLLLAAGVRPAAASVFTPLPDPGAAGTTQAFGISGGSIVGSDEDANGTSHGFVYNTTNSGFTTIDDPAGGTTHVYGISGNSVVGSNLVSSFPYYSSFVYNIANTTYATQNIVASQNTTSPYAGPVARGISGTSIVGSFLGTGSAGTDLTGPGFVYNGVNPTPVLPLPPGATEQGASGAFAYGVSGSNIVGTYSVAIGLNSSTDGFLYNGSTYTALIDPQAGLGGTFAQGISGSNIVGYYFDANSVAHGFLYNINNGIFTTVDDPLASTSGNSQGTFLEGIDGNNVVGYYTDSSGNDHSFEVTNVPEPTSISLVGVCGIVLLRRRR